MNSHVQQRCKRRAMSLGFWEDPVLWRASGTGVTTWKLVSAVRFMFWSLCLQLRLYHFDCNAIRVTVFVCSLSDRFPVTCPLVLGQIQPSSTSASGPQRFSLLSRSSAQTEFNSQEILFSAEPNVNKNFGQVSSEEPRTLCVTRTLIVFRPAWNSWFLLRFSWQTQIFLTRLKSADGIHVFRFTAHRLRSFRNPRENHVSDWAHRYTYVGASSLFCGQTTRFPFWIPTNQVKKLIWNEIWRKSGLFVPVVIFEGLSVTLRNR